VALFRCGPVLRCLNWEPVSKEGGMLIDEIIMDRKELAGEILICH